MVRRGSQRRQSLRFMGGQWVKGESEAQSQPDNEPEQDPSCQELDPHNTYQEKPLHMRQWMRWHNCKVHQMTNTAETYPSIRPPINKCFPGKNLEYIDESMEANQCGRMFTMGKDDVVAVWKQSPHKDSLACYGIGEHSEAYSEAVAKSLKAASLLPKEPKKSHVRPNFQPMVKVTQPRGTYVLNRDCLKAKLGEIPNVRRHLGTSNAFSGLHCPPLADTNHPFADQSTFPKVSIKLALGIEKPAKPPKHGLRRKHWYCPPLCDDVEINKCTEYEWAKYKMENHPADEVVMQEFEPVHGHEPRNYDELYKTLESCFIQNPDGDEICEAYEQCCKDPEDPPSQGCNEFMPEGAEAGETCSCLGHCNCERSKGGRSPKEKEQQDEESQDSDSIEPIDIE
ncbi:uncharacterized protein [Drosophila kikkawai]|uniref:Uncharacterized protein n=1 Tax=Drosophila kikkawai TaxID=30033 RepID=A0A6P4JA90_DROKI|nr:uncharacterized protein LOC108086096 [Drosophila kikkawai]